MAEKKWDVYVYGDINIDLVIPNIDKFPPPGQEQVTEKMYTYVGGGAALFTMGIGKLGLYPVFQGLIGDDCYGTFIKEELKKTNVDTKLLVTTDREKTGISISFTNENDRSFLTYEGTNQAIDITNIKLDLVNQAKHLHVTGYDGKKNHTKYLEILKEVKKQENITISFDVGWDDSGIWYEKIYELFSYIDILFMNEVEAIHYSRKENALEAAKQFAKSGPIAVIKLGKKGSLAVEKELVYHADSYTVKAVDTTGAGDSFNAGFIYGFLKGKQIKECLLCGNVCGALSVTSYGGNTSFPTEEQLIQFLQG